MLRGIDYKSDGAFTNTANDKMFSITTAGNVGVGTATPAEMLHVWGKIRAKDGFCIGTNCVANWQDHGPIDMVQTANADLYLTMKTSAAAKDPVIWLKGDQASEGLEPKQNAPSPSPPCPHRD